MALNALSGDEAVDQTLINLGIMKDQLPEEKLLRTLAQQILMVADRMSDERLRDVDPTDLALKVIERIGRIEIEKMIDDKVDAKFDAKVKDLAANLPKILREGLIVKPVVTVTPLGALQPFVGANVTEDIPF